MIKNLHVGDIYDFYMLLMRKVSWKSFHTHIF